jgi:DNA-binding Lrp family transcriptional regulator
MSALTRRLTFGPLKDGLAISARELANSANMSGNATRQALRELEAKGFIVNLTPELPIDKAVVRLTCFPFQGQPATEDYTRIPLTPEERRRLDWLDEQESKFKALRRRTSGGRR